MLAQTKTSKDILECSGNLRSRVRGLLHERRGQSGHGVSHNPQSTDFTKDTSTRLFTRKSYVWIILISTFLACNFMCNYSSPGVYQPIF